MPSKGLPVRCHRCIPGDMIKGPQGSVIYVESSLMVPNWEAWVYLVKEWPVGVLMLRGGLATLRYCEADGSTKDKPINGPNRHVQMMEGMKAIAAVIRSHIGERHPDAALLQARAGNTLPA